MVKIWNLCALTGLWLSEKSQHVLEKLGDGIPPSQRNLAQISSRLAKASKFNIHK